MAGMFGRRVSKGSYTTSKGTRKYRHTASYRAKRIGGPYKRKSF